MLQLCSLITQNGIIDSNAFVRRVGNRMRTVFILIICQLWQDAKRFEEAKVQEAFQERPRTVGVLEWRGGVQAVEHHGAAHKQRVHPRAVAVEAEFQQVGQNQVGEGGSITTQLLGLFGLIEVLFAGTLGLDVADDAVGAIPDAKVGVAGFGGLGEGGDVNVASSGGLGHLLQQMLQGSVVTLLAGIACEGHVCQVLQVLAEKRFLVHTTRIVP